MSADSPVAIIFDTSGKEVSVKDGYALNTPQSGLIVSGSDNTQTARILRTDNQGRPIITGTVEGTITGGTISGTLNVNQSLPSLQINRWPVGLSDGTQFLEQFPVYTKYQTGEILPEQNGADAVLTFTFSQAVKQAFVESNGEDMISRLNPFGGNPSATSGIPCHHNLPVCINISLTTLKVYAVTGAKINVWGMR